MAFGDNAWDVGDLDTAMARLYQLHPAKAQFHRQGGTSRWFAGRSKTFEGTRFEFNAFDTPMTNIRKSDFATARAAALPAARDISSTWLSYDVDDLCMIQGSVKWNILERERSNSRKTSIYRLAKKVFNEFNNDFVDNTNRAIHQNADAQMALVDTVYAVGGTTYSSNRYAFIKIKTGQIGQFLKGMVVNTDATESLTILDVVHGDDCWYEGTRTAGVGPGIRVDAGSGNTVDSSADDAITMSGETTGDNFHGFPDWMDPTTNVYFDEGGTAIDRDASGNTWSHCYVHTVGASGSEVEFDLDQHMRPVANVRSQMVGIGRTGRRNAEEDIVIPSAALAITTSDLVNFMVNEASDTQRFTLAMATSMDAATRKELFGEVGFRGMVYQSPTMGSVAFQADAAAQQYKIRILEISSWLWLQLHGGRRNIKWIRNSAGGRIHNVYDVDSTGRNTWYVQAAAGCAMALVCDQPAANIEITGVRDDQA